MVTFDPAKRRANRAKHGIDFADCGVVFDRPMLTQKDSRAEYGECRFVSLGLFKGRVVVLVWTDHAEAAHVISCRYASRNETKIYFSQYPSP